MIPADLLNSLREKDPGLWSKYRFTELAEIECADKECGYIRSIEQNDIIEPAQEAWLQHCLQDAIRARGWKYCIQFNPEFYAKYTSFIITNAGRKEIGAGDSAVTSLLVVYLAALEATE